MVRNRSSLVFFFLNKTRWVPLQKTNVSLTPLVVLTNRRKKLSLKLYSLGPGSAQPLLARVLTLRTRTKNLIKSRLAVSDTSVIPFFNAFSRSNQYFLADSLLSLYFAKKKNLTLWLNHSLNTPRIVFTHPYAYTVDSKKLLNTVLFSIWAYLWNFKYFRTTNQTCSFLVSYCTNQRLPKVRFFKHFFYFASIWYNLFKYKNKYKTQKGCFYKKPTKVLDLLKTIKTSPIIKYSPRRKAYQTKLANVTFTLVTILSLLFRTTLLKQLLGFYTIATTLCILHTKTK